MTSQCLSKDDTWQSILADELMGKSAITPRTLSILKDDHDPCDPNVLMNLRHNKSSNRTSQKRESFGNIMEVARRNLRTEYKEKVSGAKHKRFIDSDVEKFKQHLAHLKRINASSNKLPVSRKPLRVRFQKIAIRSRSCGSGVVKTKRNKNSGSGSLISRKFNLPDTQNIIYDFPPTLNQVTGSSSVESFSSDTSLPAVYGNSLSETTEILQKGPNTTPISFCSGILPRRIQDTESCSRGEEFFPTDFDEDTGNSVTSSPEPPTESSNTKNGVDQFKSSYCRAQYAEKRDYTFFQEIVEVRRQNRHDCCFVFQDKEEAPMNDPPDTTSKPRGEKKREVKNTAYKQFMSYVCNKSTSVKHRRNTTDKLLPQVDDEEKSSQREEKIALVLGYLQRKKISPDSTQSVTPTEPVTKAKCKVAQVISTGSLDPKTARTSGEPYEHRFQAQRNLIRQQKMQLEEQQKKIQELTLAKLQGEATNSQKDFQKTIDEMEEDCSLSIRHQLKTLKSAGSQPDYSTAGKLVERMEKRAKEREESKQLAAERRKLIEEERRKKISEEEEQRRKEEENKRREEFEKIREEKIRQREIRERTRKEQERMLELHRRAEAYNKRRLCKTGLRAFKKLLIIRNELMEKAEHYYTNKLLRTAFFTWKAWVDEKIERKLTVADYFYRGILLKNCLNNWKKELADNVRKRQVAEDMYEMRLQERVFRKWSEYVNEQHLKMAGKLATADQWYTWRLLKNAFNRWRAYPKIAHLQREKEHRKKILRQKVQDMLPDFRPVSPHY